MQEYTAVSTLSFSYIQNVQLPLLPWACQPPRASLLYFICVDFANMVQLIIGFWRFWFTSACFEWLFKVILQIRNLQSQFRISVQIFFALNIPISYSFLCNTKQKMFQLCKIRPCWGLVLKFSFSYYFLFHMPSSCSARNNVINFLHLFLFSSFNFVGNITRIVKLWAWHHFVYFWAKLFLSENITKEDTASINMTWNWKTPYHLERKLNVWCDLLMSYFVVNMPWVFL